MLKDETLEYLAEKISKDKGIPLNEVTNFISMQVEEYKDASPTPNGWDKLWKTFLIDDIGKGYLKKEINYVKNGENKIWTALVGKDRAKKLDELTCSENFISWYNITHADNYSLISFSEAPDFIYKNSNSTSLALEITQIVSESDNENITLPRLLKSIKDSIAKKDLDNSFRNSENNSLKLLLIEINNLQVGPLWNQLLKETKNTQLGTTVIDRVFLHFYDFDEHHYAPIAQ
jgi:hypothetical protein